MSYLATGFTPDEEKEVLIAARGHAATTEKLEESVKILREQERLKLITALAAVGGALFTLARFGEFIAAIRDKRKHVHL